MTVPEPFLGLGIALGLGLLVGLQRQRAGAAVAGVRTFALVTLLGAGAGMLTALTGPWTVGAGLIAVAILAWVGNVSLSPEERSKGVTTEVAMLLMFAVGAMTMLDQRPAAIVIGATCAVLLHLKSRLHGAIKWLTDEDIGSIMLLAAVMLIVMPLMPDTQIGPLGALNPRHIWMMVVLVIGISTAGFIVYRLIGPQRGTFAAGFFGGLVSSTAITQIFSRTVRSNPTLAPAVAAILALAGTTVYVRLAVELAVTAPGVWVHLAWPLGIMLLISLAMAAVIVVRARRASTGPQHLHNPAQLTSALLFAAIYALVVLASTAAHHYFGSGGTLVVAAFSGLADLDALTLSMGQQADSGVLTPAQAAAAVLIGIIANTVFKLGIVIVVAGRPLFAALWWFAAVTVVSAALLVVWLLATAGAAPMH